MSTKVPMRITAGLPFKRVIVVTLPGDRDWWTNRSDFEVVFQIRTAPRNTAPLILDATKHLTVTYSTGNSVTIEINMSGSDTRRLTKSGYYDILMSDTNSSDGRAFVIVHGVMRVQSTVSTESRNVT